MEDGNLNAHNLSFYADAQSFEAFHKYTSYYNQLQNALVTLVQAPDNAIIIDLGCAVGDTTRAIARRYPQCQVRGIDFRPEIITAAKKETPESLYPNVTFQAADMANLQAYLPSVNSTDHLVFTTLYSFHHIPDPTDADAPDPKLAFLEALYSLPCASVKVVVADETTPVAFGEENYTETTLRQWQQVAQEGYRSVFLNRYLELTSQGLPVEEAREAAILAGEYVKMVELEIGQWTAHRQDEFPLAPSELSSLFLEAEFHLELFTPANNLGDYLLVAVR